MQEENALLNALFDYPCDLANWSVYADWLEERGDVRADYLRLYCQLRRLSVRDPQYAQLNARLAELRKGLDVHWLALIDQGQRFSLLWTPEHGRRLAQRGLVGQPLRNVSSGHRLFTGAGVQSGDYIYPLYHEGGALYLAGRLRVSAVLDREQHCQQHPEDPWISEPFEQEVVLGEAATPLQLDQAIPRAVLERFAIIGRRTTRRLAVVDGRLTSVATLRGVQRLDRQIARDLDLLLAGRPLPGDARTGAGSKQGSLFESIEE